MSYGKVHDSYLDGEKIKPVSDRAALLGLWLIFGQHRNAIGCFKLGVGAITDVGRFKAWGIEGVSDALRELSDTGFIIRDEAANWIFITNAMNKDPIKGLKVAIHAAKLANAVPADSTVYQPLKAILEPALRDELKGQKNVTGWPMREAPIQNRRAIDTPSKDNRSPDPEPLTLARTIPEPQTTPAPVPAPTDPEGVKKIEVAKEPASRALRTKSPDTSDPANRKAAWEQKCQAWMLAHWSTAQFEAALNGYLEGTPFGKAEFERASTEMSAEKTDGSIKPETRLDRPPTTVGTALQPGFDRERALDIPPPFIRRSA